MRFYTSFFRNLLGVFIGSTSTLLLFIAILATSLMVFSGADWFLYEITKTHTWIVSISFPAVIIGGLIPLIVPISLYISSLYKRKLLPLAHISTQAVILGMFISSLLKALTGRTPPPHLFQDLIIGNDVTREWAFGWLNAGIFDGWPSGHATVACALGISLFLAIPKRFKMYRALALIYAMYVSIGVGFTIHWFSDAIAGALLGFSIAFITYHTFTKYSKSK